MVSSNRVTGIFAIAIVAFMVATAFVPAVNAFAASEDDAAAIATVKDGDENYNVDISDKTDLMSILSTLFGGADVSQLAEMFENIDLKALMEEVSSLDSANIMDYVKGLLKQAGIFSGDDLSGAAEIIAQYLEGDYDLDEIIKMIIEFLGLDSAKTIYIPDVIIGQYEFVGVTISIDFDDDEFSLLSIEVDKIVAKGETLEYGLEDISLIVTADVVDFYFGTLMFAGIGYEIETETILTATDDSLDLDLYISDDLEACFNIKMTNLGPQETVTVTLSEFVIDKVYKFFVADLTVEGFTFKFTDGSEAAYSASVDNATLKDGTTVTDTVNLALKQFFEGKQGGITVDLYDLSIGDIYLKVPKASMEFDDDGKLTTSVSVGKFSLGDLTDPAIAGTGLDVKMCLDHDYLSSEIKIAEFGAKAEVDEYKYEMLFKGIKQTFKGPYDVKFEAAVNYIRHIDPDGFTVEMGTGDTDADITPAIQFSTGFNSVDEDIQTLVVFVDSAKVTSASGVRYAPGCEMYGEYDGTDDRGHDFVHATFKMVAFKHNNATNVDNYTRLAYFEADYKNTDLAATMHTSCEVYSEKRHMTYLTESRIVFGEESVHSEVRTGIGLGQSVHLGGDRFFCVFVTGSPDELESDYYVEYQMKGDNQAKGDEEPIWRLGIKVGEDNGVISVRAKDLDYGGISVGDFTLRFVMEDGVVRTAVVMEDVSAGYAPNALSTEILVMRTVTDGFTGQTSFHIATDDVRLGKTVVSERAVFEMTVDKDGKFVSAPTASGDLDLTLKDLEVVADKLYVNGTAKITDGKLAVSMTFGKTKGASDLGSFTVTDDAFDLKLDKTDVGPFTELNIDMAFGNVEKYSLSYDASKVVFESGDNGTDRSFISGLQRTGNTFKINGMALGLHQDSANADPVYDIQSAAVTVSLKDGYTIKLDCFGTALSYKDEDGNEYAKIKSWFGSAGADQIDGLKIVCAKDEDGKLTTEFTFNINYMDSAVKLGEAMVLKGSIGFVGKTDEYVSVVVKENQFGDTISFSVSNYSSKYALSLGADLDVWSVTANNVNYAENVKDGVTALEVGSIDIRSHHGNMGISTLQMTDKDRYSINGFYVTGFNHGSLINDGVITIDDTAADRTVVQIPKLKLDQTASEGGNKLDIADVKLTFTEGSDEPEVEIASVDAEFKGFLLTATVSTINGTVSYDATKPLQTEIDIEIDQILEAGTTIKGLTYSMSFTPSGAPYENVLAFESLAHEHRGGTLAIANAQFDFLEGIYTVGNISLNEYKVGGIVYNADIEKLVLQYHQGVSLVPEAMFSVESATITAIEPDGHIWTVTSSDGINASLHTSSAQTGGTVIVLAFDGDLVFSRTNLVSTAAIAVSVSEFTAEAKSSSDRSSWDVEIYQKAAKVTVYTADMDYYATATLDCSGDYLSGKMTMDRGVISITGAYTHDDKLTLSGSDVEDTSQEYIGSGALSLTAPADVSLITTASMSYKYTLDRLIVTEGDKTVEAEVEGTGFELSIKSGDTYTATLCATANVSYSVGSQMLAIQNLHLDAELTADPEDLEVWDIASASFTADRFTAGMDYVTATLNTIVFEDGVLRAHTMDIGSTEPGNVIDITFHNVSVFGNVFYAGYMEGTVNEFDVNKLAYDGEKIFAYIGLFYFGTDGIKAFANNEPIDPSIDHTAVIYVPSYEMTFIEEEDQSFTVPYGAVVDLGGYYDVMPVPDIQLGVPVTTDMYRVQHCNVELAPAPTLLDRLKESPQGIIVLEAGSGIVYNSEMLDQISLEKITIVTPQGVSMTISVDALKTLASGCETTVLGVTLSYADDHEHYLKDILNGLNEKNAARVLDGRIIHVDTGNSVNTEGLGEVKITIPYDLAPGADVPQFSSYTIHNDTMIYNGVSTYDVIDGEGYLTFTVSHFSTFLVCEKLDFQPSDNVVYIICIVMIAIAAIAAAAFFRRQSTL